jgi:dTDP-4-amino-4,6-dideoxygalactose transaminase/nucleoside-diphosphate-sugar epimerase
MKKILVTGGAGYLGCMLSRKLLDKGYSVRCFDRLYFGEEAIKDILTNPGFELIKGNIIDLGNFPDLLEDIDGIIHLAGLANDPTAELNPELTKITNHGGSVELARRAKEKGIGRFIFASSCSVYGQGLSDQITEESPLNPVSIYAESKITAEKAIDKFRDDTFCPVYLRQATLFGKSNRMRFDLAINLMVVNALIKKKIFVYGGGRQWRPFLHVEDAAEAFITCLESDKDKVSGQVFNVGDSTLNFEIIDLARFIKSNIKGTELEIVPDAPDKRSYRVCFDKITETTGWKPEVTVKTGIKELSKYLSSGEIKDFDTPKFYNIKTLLKYLDTPAIEGGDPVRYDFLPFNLPLIGEEEIEEVIDTLRSGWLTTGPKTKKLEQDFCEYVGTKNAVCVNSCTAALHLSLVSLGIGEGDEVITSPVTWPSTANVILHTGAKPIFCDIDQKTFNIDPLKLEEKITKRTKAVIPVHMSGYPCDMDKIHEIAAKNGLRVIEDAAHAIGAEYRGKKIGTLSDITCFSFYPTKNMTTIEGGLLTTDNDEIAENVRINSLHGVSKDAWKRYLSEDIIHHEVVYPGFKYNMTDVQASLGLHQLRKLDDFIERRKAITSLYNNAFKSIGAITLPADAEYIKNTHHLYIILLDLDKLSVDRDRIMSALNKEKIGTGIHFRSLHLHKYYREKYSFQSGDFPVASDISQRIISLPLYPKMNRYDIDTVIKAVRKIISYYAK